MENRAPASTLDPIVTLSVLAHETTRVGFIATGSTTYNEPYNPARQFKALDVLSRGRMGWNAVTTSDPIAVANYGEQVRPRAERYERAHEMITIVQALWGSWGEDAWVGDVDTGQFWTWTRSSRSARAASISPPAGRWSSRPRSRASLSSPPLVAASTA